MPQTSPLLIGRIDNREAQCGYFPLAMTVLPANAAIAISGRKKSPERCPAWTLFGDDAFKQRETARAGFRFLDLRCQRKHDVGHADRADTADSLIESGTSPLVSAGRIGPRTTGRCAGDLSRPKDENHSDCRTTG
jgi:hypothetical protein